MDEVDAGARLEGLERRPSPGLRMRFEEHAPADVRHLQRPARGQAAEVDRTTGDEAQSAGSTELVALLEEQLHAEADAEQRPTRCGVPPQRLDEAATFELAHPVGERAHAGEHEPLRTLDGLGALGEDDLGARTLERPADAEEVAEAVVDDGDQASPHPAGT